ncbi:MAG: DUF362 domain-containing protein, partial [Bacteroidales bacterium]|nr:DUF362 domain-containing protein [Bacteroidales bacterium]
MQIDQLAIVLSKWKVPVRIIVVLTGCLSLIWFLIRVVPKPSRASYPCMQVAAPWASGFVIYLMGITASMLSFQKFRRALRSSKYLAAGMFLFIGIGIYFLILPFQSEPVFSSPLNAVPLEAGNQPMGVGKGIFPGRVIWVFDKDATNANCSNAFNDGYFLENNTNQEVVDEMLQEAILQISGETDLTEAWHEIFKFHNGERNKGAVGYTAGEKIFLKINRTSAWSENINTTDFSRKNNPYYAISETSPQLVTSVLRQLVNVVGVPQAYIYVGDPMKHIYNDDYTKWHGEFPGVNYFDYKYNSMGRQKVVASTTAVINFSDNGTVLKTGTWASALTGDPVYKDYLYTIFEEMEYMLNLPTLKGHKFSGVTMFAKNHFGSHVRADAKHLHGGLVKPSPSDPLRNSYGMYRVMVDIMGHDLLGRKNLLYIMDALYSSEMEVSQPVKFQKSPWNNHWSSSIFVSLDPV